MGRVPGVGGGVSVARLAPVDGWTITLTRGEGGRCGWVACASFILFKLDIEVSGEAAGSPWAAVRNMLETWSQWKRFEDADCTNEAAQEIWGEGPVRSPTPMVHSETWTICATCKGRNVQTLEWIRPNEHEIVDDGDPYSDGNWDEGNNWCEDCESNVPLTTTPKETNS